MAKASTPAKKKVGEVKVKTPAKKKAVTPSLSIDKVSEQVLKQLQTLKIEGDLRNDIEWCLGSFHHDKNPAGLFDTAVRALVALKEVKAKTAKSVPAKLITDLEKILKSR
jgi:hypothetical protein